MRGPCRHARGPSLGLLLLLAALVWGCARAPLPRPVPEQSLAARRILAAIQQRADRIRTLAAAGRLRLRTAEGPVAAEAVLVTRAPDALRLEIRDPLGGMQALLIARGGEATLLLPDKKALPLDRRALGRVLGKDLAMTDLVGLFSGTPPLPRGEGAAALLLGLDREGTRLQALDRSRPAWELRLGPQGRVREWRRFRGSGSIPASLAFDDFREVEGISLPFSIRFQGADGRGFELDYRSLLLNTNVEDRLFEVPARGGAAQP